MAQTFNQNTLEYDLGWNTGVGLAKIDVAMNEQAVMMEANEMYDRTPLRSAMDRWQFVLGVVNGYAGFRDGIV